METCAFTTLVMLISYLFTTLVTWVICVLVGALFGVDLSMMIDHPFVAGLTVWLIMLLVR